MKKGKSNKKEVSKAKLKKTKNSITGKQIRQFKAQNLVKVISLKFRPIIKAYVVFQEKRKIKRLKEERTRQQEKEEQKLKENEKKKQQQQEARKLKKEEKLKAEQEKKLKVQEEQIRREKKKKEEQQEQEKQDRIYKERLVKGEQERLDQLDKASKFKEEEKRLIEERNLMRQRRLESEQKRSNEKKLDFQEKEGLDEKNTKRLNGKVKWFSDSRGYGFIEREGVDKDIFVHFSAVRYAGIKNLKEGEQLTFEVENTNKGLSAINLHKISQL